MRVLKVFKSERLDAYANIVLGVTGVGWTIYLIGQIPLVYAVVVIIVSLSSSSAGWRMLEKLK